jgi:hypothetical protein
VSLFEDNKLRARKELLAEIHNQTTALPDFRRDFVWGPEATQDLIVSIASNCPAGSQRLINRGRTLCDHSTNQLISNRAPSAYLADIRKTNDFPLDAVLTSHCLPAGETSRSAATTMKRLSLGGRHVYGRRSSSDWQRAASDLELEDPEST